jgi:anti-sigma regulatory factor (Ser/Thr protein kinase)
VIPQRAEPVRAVLEVPRAFAALEVIFERLNAVLEDPRVDDRTVYVIRLAVEELFTNMVKYNPDGAPAIGITAVLEGGSITVSMMDRGGTPFDVTVARTPDLDRPMEERRVGGLGLHLVRRLVDRLEYSHEDDHTTITFIKTLERQ